MVLNLPPGLFQTLLDLWFMLRTTYVSIISTLTGWVVNTGNGEMSLLSGLIGSGVVLVISIKLVKMFLP